MRKVHELGLIMNVVRLKDFYISKKDMKIVLGNVKGIGEADHYGKIFEVPDISINLPSYKGPGKAKDGSIIFDPCIAPEIFFKQYKDNSVYIDTWSFGCILYEILFGVPPESFVKKLHAFHNPSTTTINKIDFKIAPDHPSKRIFNFRTPSNYFFYQVYPDKFTKYIMMMDYQ